MSYAFNTGGALELALNLAWDAGSASLTLKRTGGNWPLPPESDWQVDALGLGARKLVVKT